MNVLLYKKDRFVGSSGGTERVLSDFSNAFIRRGHRMTFLLNERKKGLPFFPLDQRVDYINHGGTRFPALKHALFKFLLSFSPGRWFLEHFPSLNEYKHTAKCLNNIILPKKPDVIVVAGLPELIDILDGVSYEIPVLLMLHNTPEVFFRSNKNGRLDLLKNLLSRVSLVQVLMPGFATHPLLKKYYSGPTVVIGNTVPEQKTSIRYEENKKSYLMTYLARLCPVKNQELVIQAFSLVAHKYPEWEIEFWGSDDDEKYTRLLTGLISRHGLEKQIRLMGVTRQPEHILAQTDLCPFSSNFEGFGLGLTEAMSMGIPCIGLQKADAVNQLIVHGQTGLLSDDTPEAFAQALEKMITSPLLRKELGINARNSLTRFAPDRIWTQWEQTLQSLIPA